MAAKLYVGGLSYSTTSETLREYFSQCGTVESASVVTDKFSGQSRGLSLIHISELNGKDLDGRKLTVNVSNPRPAGGGGGGRGPGGRGGRPGGPGGRGGGDRAAYGVPPSKKPFRW